MIEENIITVLFCPNLVLVNFILEVSDCQIQNFSAYLVPDTSAVYYPPNKSNWVCVSTSDFFRKEHLVLCQGVFSKRGMKQR